MNITLAQLNYTVGDIAGNSAKILEAARSAQPADLMVFSELCMCGYPPEDLVLRPSFQEASMQAVEQLAVAAKELNPLLIGSIWVHDGRLYNAALLLSGGKIIHKQFKHLLPNYGVFDEKRVFSAGEKPKSAVLNNKKIGILICEDMWSEETADNLKNTDVICVLNGSPFEMDKVHQRHEKAAAITKYTNATLVYVNQVGGQDEVVFDGSSFVMNAAGEVTLELAAWEECVQRAECSVQEKNFMHASRLTSHATIYQALVTGLRDYVNKNGFPSVLLGMSGGVDSALVATIAADALGADKVRAVMLPSRYTSKDSLEDAQECAKLLGIKYESISIEPMVEQAVSSLTTSHKPLSSLTQENLQSRIRGLLLMGLSNQTGAMLLSTGNKSEMAMGYATLYGDMCGGFNPLKDVYKTTVYALCHWRNGQGRVIPERIITKAPTAELKENQTDQDTLPPYPVLDAILKLLIEAECSVKEIVGQGFEVVTVRRIQKMLQTAEYKRRQAPPGVKITSKAFGRDRRYPMTNKF